MLDRLVGRRRPARSADVRAGLDPEHHRDVHEHDRGARLGRQAGHHRARGLDGRRAGDDRGPGRPGRQRERDVQGHSGPAPFNGDIVGNATWGDGAVRVDRRAGAQHQPDQDQRVPHRLQPPANGTNSFIELYNAGDEPGRHLRLDADRAPDPAGHLLEREGARTETHARRAPVLGPRPVELRPGGSRERR